MKHEYYRFFYARDEFGKMKEEKVYVYQKIDLKESMGKLM